MGDAEKVTVNIVTNAVPSKLCFGAFDILLKHVTYTYWIDL